VKNSACGFEIPLSAKITCRAHQIPELHPCAIPCRRAQGIFFKPLRQLHKIDRESPDCGAISKTFPAKFRAGRDAGMRLFARSNSGDE
jgi:hypothetical protein